MSDARKAFETMIRHDPVLGTMADHLLCKSQDANSEYLNKLIDRDWKLFRAGFLAATPPPLIDWCFGLDKSSGEHLFAEFCWLLLHGALFTAWNWKRPFPIGCGRSWYDGPHWRINLGIFNISLSAE